VDRRRLRIRLGRLTAALLGVIIVSACGPEAEQARWVPAPGIDWQWQLQGELDTTQQVPVWGLDMGAPRSSITALRSRGARLICYFSAGTRESWREDAEDFPPHVVGRTWSLWPDEQFVDYRRLEDVGPIMEARLDRCRDAGFDAVEPDVIDSFTEPTGFALRQADARRYLEWLIEKAHSRGMSIALKNTPELADVPVDFAIVEDCFADRWCDRLAPIAGRGKAILAAEYTDRVSSISAFCEDANRAGISVILKDRDLALPQRSSCASPRQ